MANFAELNENNYVLRVVRVGNDVPTSNGPLGENNMHLDGEEWCKKFFKGGKWKQTSFHNEFRNIGAAVGSYYNADTDEFYPRKDYESWVLSEDKKQWKPPIEYPTIPENLNEFNPLVSWDEANLRWIGSNDNGQTIFAWDPINKTWGAI